MKKEQEFDNILDESLEKVLRGDATVNSCLKSYPEHAAELEPLLTMALQAKKAAAVTPNPEFRNRARHQFRAALQEMELKRERRFVGWMPQWATVVATVLIVVLLGSGGTVAAASDSLPDEPLYPVKLTTETVRLALTPSPLGKAELYARLADERIEEIAAMAARGKPEQVEQTANRLNHQLLAMAEIAESQQVAMQSQEAAFLQSPEVTTAAATSEAAVEETTPLTAGEATPPPEIGPALSHGMKGRNGAGAEEGVAVADSVTVEAADSGAQIENRARLREVLAEHAAGQQQALREMLQSAPESVRAALRQAIDDTDEGYQRALKALD